MAASNSLERSVLDFKISGFIQPSMLMSPLMLLANPVVQGEHSYSIWS